MKRALGVGMAVATSGWIGLAAAPQPAPAPSDSAAVTAMIASVRDAAGPRWADAVHFWCEAPRPNQPNDPVIAPTRIFDNVYAIGNTGTTVYVIRTSAGLLMIDALGGGDAVATSAQLDTQLLPGFQRLGLNPSDVKVILVTHGHADHYGGAAYFQRQFGSRVYVSAADWKTMEGAPARGGGGAAAPPTPVPNHDGEIVDGVPIALGDLTVQPVAVPGHTPGAMAFVFPVNDNGRRRMAAVFGGAWLTPQILSDEALETYRRSVARFKAATAREHVEVLLQNHMLMDPIQPKLDALNARSAGEPNPFVVGESEYQKFVDVMDGCTRVNLARRGRPAQ
jgi:metallo-beta-lactamase class B